MFDFLYTPSVRRPRRTCQRAPARARPEPGAGARVRSGARSARFRNRRGARAARRARCAPAARAARAAPAARASAACWAPCCGAAPCRASSAWWPADGARLAAAGRGAGGQVPADADDAPADPRLVFFSMVACSTRTSRAARTPHPPATYT